MNSSVTGSESRLFAQNKFRLFFRLSTASLAFRKILILRILFSNSEFKFILILANEVSTSQNACFLRKAKEQAISEIGFCKNIINYVLPYSLFLDFPQNQDFADFQGRKKNGAKLPFDFILLKNSWKPAFTKGGKTRHK